MNAFECLAAIIRYTLFFTAGMSALGVGCVFVISGLSPDNPLKRILSALAVRFAATAAMGILSIPAESIPGINTLWDAAAPLALLGLWITLLFQLRSIRRDSRSDSDIVVRTIRDEQMAANDVEATGEPRRLTR